MHIDHFTVDGAPFFSLGAQAHNASCYDLKDMEWAFRGAKALGLNTIAVPVYWEQIEPEEGVFDFSVVSALILRCRKEGLKLSILWFGTWKNGKMSFVPRWVKADTARFRRVLTHDGYPVSVLSSYCRETLEADKRAFSRLVKFIKKMDQRHKTVLAIQVENEPGIVGSFRDYDPEGVRHFESAVPEAVIQAVRDTPISPVYRIWQEHGAKTSGTWPEVFGERAGEYAACYSIAQFVDEVTQAGKAVYDEVPYYINADLDLGHKWPVGGVEYFGAGPHTHGLPFYKAGMPHIDLICPDIYEQDWPTYQFEVDVYKDERFPLYIPESSSGGPNAKYLFYAIQEGTIGFHVFGLESMFDEAGALRPEAKEMADSFRMLRAIQPLLLKYRGTGRVHAIMQQEHCAEQHIHLEGGAMARICFYSALGEGEHVYSDYIHRGRRYPQEGRGLLIQVSEKEFYLVGDALTLHLAKPFQEDGRTNLQFSYDRLQDRGASYMLVDEGHFDEAGNFVVDRHRNGDERDYSIWATADVGVIHIEMSDWI